MNIFKRIKGSFAYRVPWLIEHIKFALLPKKNVVLLAAWAEFANDKILKSNNYGDDINLHIIHHISKCKVLNWRFFRNNQINILCIGSIIETYTNKHSIIWGSGCMFGDKTLSEKPYHVCAVRGKLTREHLIEQGIECPEIYGDPALLLPYIYKPQTKKKYKWGLIPHRTDEKNNDHKMFFDSLNECTLISFAHYTDWHDVIDRINECECIISSSLHGLIISDAYKVPNIWIEFSNKVLGCGFKFLDYFSSVNRKTTEPVNGRMPANIESLEDLKKQYMNTQIDIMPLLQSAPFKIDHEFIDFVKNNA